LHHILFIGPSYQSIQKMGIKDVAKAEMIAANVPVVPGSDFLNRSHFVQREFLYLRHQQ
jgi:acetyl/propionyl-CoA carboxylase alpha subunit